MEIELISSAWHVLSSFLVFMAGLLLVPWLGRKFQLRRKRVLIVYIWHTIFCILYMEFVINFGGDAIGYYFRGAAGTFDFKFGTAAVDFLTHLLILLGGLSFFGLFLFYNIFGFIGLVAYDASLRVATLQSSSRIKRLATLAIFMPSISFWSAGIGKDALSFMAVGLALWAALALQRRMILMGFAILVMLLVRPHMAGIMVLALAAAIVFGFNQSLKSRILIGGISLAAAAVLVPLAISYAGLDESANVVDIQEYFSERQEYNIDGGGGVDIVSMSLPEKLYTYVFRPTLFEARNLTSLAASLDNAFLLALAVLAARGYVRKRLPDLVGQRLFMWFYVTGSWVVLASTTANLGIAVRQKWMFVPFLVFLLIPFIGTSRKAGDAFNSSVRKRGGAK